MPLPVRRRHRPSWSALPITIAAALCLIAPISSALATAPVTVTDYTDPGEMLGAREKSHWMQPWRSYTETMPARTLLDAVGINFNVKPAWAEQTARLLEESGFRRARFEMGWSTISYAEPSRMNPANREAMATILRALRDHGIRPLILLNANSGGPCPVKEETITLTQPAAKGDTVLHVDPADVGKIVPRKTGIRSGGTAANYLFTGASPDGTVTLSAPLGALWATKPSQPVVGDLPAGPLTVETLLREPFAPERLADGSPNPALEPTMRGWLDYVGVVTREAEAILGSEEFDVEVWNELSFGSRFLNISGYYKPAPYTGSTWNQTAILKRTVAYLRDPAHGVPNIGIGNGFSNESPGWSPEGAPVGLTAMDKHPYGGWRSFPTAEKVEGVRPLDGLGNLSGIKVGESWAAEFTPDYDVFFPEFFLSALPNQTLVRDLSPVPNWYAGAWHGRHVETPGGEPLEHWITEFNLAPTSGPAREMTTADVRHVESKVILRALASFVNKGMTAVHFYAANAGSFSLIDPAFFKALQKSAASYPGSERGGETMDAVRRLLGAFAGATDAAPRNLTLDELTDYGQHVQFEGNGTTRFPPLYDRDVFAFLPFQVDAHRFVVPVYVMTRNVVEVHGEGSDPTRFDMPADTFRMTIGGVDGREARAWASDPLTGSQVPVEIVSRNAGQLGVEMPVTDSPRLLTIEEGDGAVPPVAEPRVEEPPAEDPPVEQLPAEEPPVEDPAADEPPAEAPTTDEPSADEPAAEEPSAEEPAPVVVLRGGKKLLRTRTLDVAVRCQTSCTVSARGTLFVGSRSFAMRTTPRGAVSSGARPRPTTIRLEIGPGLAQRARLSLQDGAQVRVAVEVRAETAGGEASSVARLSLQR
ncbi:MAG TPA: hypothetical protein VN752_10650 [Solirubrobacterales bacterium]|nr:hypothetical protein [Solirubrobacterales bacterium]